MGSVKVLYVVSGGQDSTYIIPTDALLKKAYVGDLHLPSRCFQNEAAVRTRAPASRHSGASIAVFFNSSYRHQHGARDTIPTNQQWD